MDRKNKIIKFLDEISFGVFYFIVFCAVGVCLSCCTNPRFVLIYEDGETAHKKLKIESMTQIGVVEDKDAEPVEPVLPEVEN